MPRWLRRFLRRKTIKQHLFIACGLALFTRALCAFFVFGPQALDDYKHGVWPAYEFFATRVMDLPDYRSPLLVWILAGFIRVGSIFGVGSALGQVRVMYFGLALISMLGVAGTYLMVKKMRSRLFAPLSLYLTAIFPIMPFVSTRAFGEAVALSFVLLGFGVLEPARRRSCRRVWVWTLGFSWLGVATLFRFHAGLLFVVYGLVLIHFRKWRGVTGAVIAGLLTIGAQALIDIISGKAPLATLFIYLSENEGGAAQYGISPWYNTWAFILALSLAPFSFVLVRAIPGLWRRHWPWLLPFLLFVLVHSMVPHKEERFMYPVMGLELWALAWLWSANALNPLARKVFSPVLLGIGVPLLLIFCLVNTQEGEIGPPALIESRYKAVTYLDHESLFGMSLVKFYFLRPPSILEKVDREDFNISKIDSSFVAHPEHRAVVLLTSVPDAVDELRALENEDTEEGHCLTLRTAGSVIDRLIYSLNPRHNERRRPTWYLICERDQT